MQEAIKAVSTMRGHDLREFMLLAFGGAGPLHACRIAADLGMAGVIVPLHPGVYSAMGLVMSQVKHDHIRSRMSQLARIDEAGINAVFAELEATARAELADEQFGPGQIEIEHALDLRYAGQGYEVTLPVEAPLADGGKAELRRAFDESHAKTFGHTAPDEPVEIVSWRVRGIGRVPPVELPRYERTGAPLAGALRETRSAVFDGRTLDCPVYQRDLIDVGAEIAGPALIDQLDATTVLPPGHVAHVDVYRNLIVRLGAR